MKHPVSHILIVTFNLWIVVNKFAGKIIRNYRFEKIFCRLAV